MKEVGSTEIQTVLYNVFLTLGFDHEEDPDAPPGSDPEFDVSWWSAHRLANRPFYVYSDGSVRFILVEEEGKPKATKIQTQVHEALTSIHFKFHEDPSGKVGGPQKFTLPRAAVRWLHRRDLVVSADGSVKTKRDD